jgi:hypothetical protein
MSWEPVNTTRELEATGDSQRGREAVNTEFERSTMLEALTRQRLGKTEQTEEA